nr:response regulator transcription factor [Micromonospora sp. DSM 115978]
MATIVIVEEVGLLRRALRTVLSSEDDLEVVADVACVEDAFGIARAVRPDVLVVGLGSGPAGLATLSRLTQQVPDCAVLALTAMPGPDLLQEALRAGVRGFVGKDLPPAALVDQIRAVAKGELVVDPGAAVAALNPSPSPLTDREREVLRVAAEGLPLKEIANRLYLAHGTVRNHLSAVMRKTGTRNRLEAIRRALAEGWI